jgi:hypothetical protein
MVLGLRTAIYPVPDLAAVRDPFGNVFGLIENSHFDPKAVR